MHRRSIEDVFAGYAASRRKRRAWSRSNAGNRAIREELMRALERTAGDALAGSKPLLDIGCGTGWLLAELARRGVEQERLHGVDLLPDRVAAASAAVPGATLVQGDCHSLPWEDATFGCVFAITLLSSLRAGDDVRAALREAARVTAPEGRIVVYDVRLPNPANRATRMAGLAKASAVLGPPAATTTLTLLPPVARRLGRLTARVYPVLAAAPPLRSHRLSVWNPPRPALRSAR